MLNLFPTDDDLLGNYILKGKAEGDAMHVRIFRQYPKQKTFSIQVAFHHIPKKGAGSIKIKNIVEKDFDTTLAFLKSNDFVKY